MTDIQILIPMSGLGSRFKAAGYKELKPLIPVHGHTIIEYVTRMFDGASDFTYLCRHEHLAELELESVIKGVRPDAKIIAVEGAKKGPMFSVQQALPALDPDRPVMICYCDFYQRWSFADFADFVKETNCDGAIPCYRGFHPHLLHEKNLYASCRLDEQPPHRVLEIREKYSFTQNKGLSPQSSGMYYFKSGRLLTEYTNRFLVEGPALNGEYYSSLIYQLLINDGLDIRVYDKISHFCQWGTPEDLQEYQYWAKTFGVAP